MRTAVSNSKGKAKLKYSEIRDMILAEEVRMKDSREISDSSAALNVDSRGRASAPGKESRYRDKSKSRSGQQATCWNCGKVGHIRRNCRNPKKSEIDGADIIAEVESDALLLAVRSTVDDWVLDSGASFHSTSHREFMKNYVAGNFGKVFMADGRALKVAGTGDIDVALPNKSTWTLKKVRYVPGMKKNLISVGQLNESGHSVAFSNSTWKVTKGALVVARGKKTDTLYMATGASAAAVKSIARSTTPVAARWSVRDRRHPQRTSHAVKWTNGGGSKSYKKVLVDGCSSKWELTKGDTGAARGIAQAVGVGSSCVGNPGRVVTFEELELGSTLVGSLT